MTKGQAPGLISEFNGNGKGKRERQERVMCLWPHFLFRREKKKRNSTPIVMLMFYSPVLMSVRKC